MVFSSNPLSLSVTDAAFDSWLRESGYLDVIDNRHTIATEAAEPAFSATTTAASPTNYVFGLLVVLVAKLWTLISLFTLNPFSKLTTDDFSGETPSWTGVFFGDFGSYSFPASASQGKLRVHENVKRYARNYASLSILFFACSLYQMPLALFGLIASLALWDVIRFGSERWGLDYYPVAQQILVRVAQCATFMVLMYLNVQMALVWAVGVSYTVMVLHAAFRKLTPVKQPTRGRQR